MVRYLYKIESVKKISFCPTTNYTMGLVQSRLCVNLAMLPPAVWLELQEEDFTVQRNSHMNEGPNLGQPGCAEEGGWKIQKKPHSSYCTAYKAGQGPTDSEDFGDAVATKCAKGTNDVWRIFMNNGLDRKDGMPHACGWRICDPSRRTFWPTRCKTPMEKEAWWRWFDTHLENLLITSLTTHEIIHAEGNLP